MTLPLDWNQVPHIPTSSKNGRAYKVKKSLYYSNFTRELCSLNLQKPVLIYWNLYHAVWADKIIYSPYTLAQPFIFPCTLGCTVARTTNASAVANGPPQLSEKHWLIESWHNYYLISLICPTIMTKAKQYTFSRMTLKNSANYFQL